MQPIGNGQLQLMRPSRLSSFFGTKSSRGARNWRMLAVCEIKLAGFQKRRGKRWTFQRLVFKKLHDPRTAKLWIARNVDVVGPGFFKRKANELAAALDGRLIIP